MTRQLQTSTACPACGHRLTLIDGIKAPTPFAIRCSGCRQILRVHYRPTVPILIGLIPLFGASFALIPQVASRLGVFAAILYGFWLLLGCLAAEVGYGVLLYTFARFTVSGQKTVVADAVPVKEIAPVPETSATPHWWTRYDARPQENETRVKSGERT